jgi:N-methylhydantoinase B
VDWTDGTYLGETWRDHDFHGQHDIAVRATITIAGDSLAIDFAGSDAQAHGFINSPLTNTRSFVFAAIATVLPSDIPINDGLMCPVRVEVPAGSIVNPLPPAPCGHATAIVGAEVIEAVLKALEGAIPERVGVNAHKLPLAYTHGRDPRTGTAYVNLNFHGYTGGAGAAYGLDGWGLYPPIMAGVILPSIEMTEIQYPCRILVHEVCTNRTSEPAPSNVPTLSSPSHLLSACSRPLPRASTARKGQGAVTMLGTWAEGGQFNSGDQTTSQVA